jgi:hypothetical protein
MAWKLSQEGIDKFEELKKEHPDYAETIDAILRLDREGNLESAMIMLNLIKIINEGLGR